MWENSAQMKLSVPVPGGPSKYPNQHVENEKLHTHLTIYQPTLWPIITTLCWHIDGAQLKTSLFDIEYDRFRPADFRGYTVSGHGNLSAREGAKVILGWLEISI